VRWLGIDEVVENRCEVRQGRLTGGRQRWGCRQTNGGVFFYSRALCGGNVILRNEVEREVMAQRGGRATGVHARTVRRNSDITVAVALRGGDAEGVCPYVVGMGELARGWHWTGPRGKRACASTPCLRGTRLGSWRARRGRTQCQQGRRKQRRCTRRCRQVLGTGIAAVQQW
jgi:hypothetical protein